MVVYFPESFPKNGDPETTTLRIKRVNAMLESIINPGDKHKREIFNVEKQILERDKPKIWNVWKPENMERILEVDFAKFGIAVTENTGQKLSETTTFEFYATVEHLKEKHSK